jgi:hypothetical protein
LHSAGDMPVSVIQLHQFSRRVLDERGRPWTGFAMGGRREDGSWIGWLEFASDWSREVRVTLRETTQPTFATLVYWATGIEPVYLDGAFERSMPAPGPALPLSGERLVA